MLDHHQKVLLLERALYEGRFPGSNRRLTVTDTWVQLTTPGARESFQNLVCRSILAEAEVEDRISSTVEEYRALGLPFLWVVSPSSRPTDLAARLVARGFSLSFAALGMLAEPEQIQIESEPRVTIELAGEHELATWAAVYAAGFQLPKEAAERLRLRLARQLSSGAPDEPRALRCLARFDGASAGVATLVLCGDYALLQGGVVLPEYRRRGVFRSIVAFCRGVFEGVCDFFYYGSEPGA